VECDHQHEQFTRLGKGELTTIPSPSGQPLAVSTFYGPADASLVQVAPLIVGIVHCDSLAGLRFLRYQNYALRTEPSKSFELTVRATRTVDEFSMVALPYLILTIVCLTLHNICVAKVSCD